MTQFIYFPVVVLGIAALIVLGVNPNFTSNGTVTLTPQNSNNCKFNIFANGFDLLTQTGCYLTAGITGYIFPISIYQYTNTTTVTSCIFFPEAGNPCFTSTVTGQTGSSTTINSCTTFGALVIPLGCVSSVVTSQLTPASVQQGFLAVVFVLLGVAVISGFTIISSGLNPATIYIVFKVMGYTIVWFILSGIAYPLFYGTTESIPYPFGSLLYLGLSLSFLLGIYREV